MYRNVTTIIVIIIINVYLSMASSIDNLDWTDTDNDLNLMYPNAKWNKESSKKDSMNKRRRYDAVSSENLYSEFNNQLDEISNYAKNKFDSELSPSLDQIYNSNGEQLLEMELRRQQRHKDASESIPIENVNEADKLNDNKYFSDDDSIYVAAQSFNKQDEMPLLQFINQLNDIHIDDHKMAKRMPLPITSSYQKSFSAPVMHSSSLFSMPLLSENQKSRKMRRRNAKHKSSRTSRELLPPSEVFKKSSKESYSSSLSSNLNSDTADIEAGATDIEKIPNDQVIYDNTVGDKNVDYQNNHHHLLKEFSSSSLNNDNEMLEDNKENDKNNWKFSSSRSEFPSSSSSIINSDLNGNAKQLSNSDGNEKKMNPDAERNIRDAFTGGLATNTFNTDASAYPNVLTGGNKNSPTSLVNSIQALPSSISTAADTTAISLPSPADLMSKINAIDPKAMEMYLKSPVEISPVPDNDRIPKQTPPQSMSSDNVSNVLEEVLVELESLKQCKMTRSGHPEGAPCSILGSWNSQVIGLRFNLAKAVPSENESSFVRKRGVRSTKEPIEPTKISVDAHETNPPRSHELLDFTWRFSGNTQKQFGGPVVIVAHKTEENSLATFAGFCRTCGSVDTIFGSWTFVYPSRDCHDMAVSIENKRDVLRRSSMEAKKKELMQKYLMKSKKKS